MTSKDNTHHKIIENLTCFSIPDNNSDLPEKLIQQIIVLSIYKSEKSLSSEGVKNSIKELFLLDFESEEVNSALESLISDNKLLFISNKYGLENKFKQELDTKHSISVELENKIFSEWIEYIKKEYPDLTEEDQECLLLDLKEYLNKFFVTYSDDCLSFLMGDRKIDDDDSYDSIIDSLPTRPFKNIQSKEYPKFVIESDGDRRKFLFDSLGVSFLYRAINIDPKCTEFIRDENILKEYEIFIDTNLIYSLTGLNSPEKNGSVKKVLDLLKNLGVKTYVTPVTLKEFNSSRERAENFLKHNKSIPSADIVKIVEEKTSGNFVTEFWRQNKELNISKEEFFAKYSNVADILKGHDIKITDKYIKDAGRDKTRINKIYELLKNEKKKEIAEHDAFHISYIHTLRERENSQKTNKKFLFLTHDHLLPIIERKVFRATRDDLQVIMSHQIVQIFRWFIPRSEEFESAYMKLASMPLARSQEVVPTKFVTSIVAKIAKYKDLPPQLVAKIITDSRISSKISSLRDKDDEALESIINSETLKILEDEIKEKEKHIKLSNEKSDKISSLQAEVTELKDLSSNLKKEVSRKANIKKYTKIALVVFLYLLCIKPVWLLIKIVYNEFNIEGGAAIVYTIIIYFLLFLLFLSYPLGLRWSLRVVNSLLKKYKEYIK